MGKTIREISDEIGVSRQAIYRKIKCKPLSTSLQGKLSTVDNKLTVSVDGEKLIKKAFFKDEVSTTVNQFTGETVNQFTAGDSEVDSFSDEKKEEKSDQSVLYEILKAELEEKNKQIERLQDELEKERQHSRKQSEKIAVLADQAQKLQLAQITPQLRHESTVDNEKSHQKKAETHTSAKPQHRTIWEKFLRK